MIKVNKEVITVEQFEKFLNYMMDEKRGGSFRYLIYDVMGFKQEDYCWLHSTALMEFKDYIYDMRAKIRKLDNKNDKS